MLLIVTYIVSVIVAVEENMSLSVKKKQSIYFIRNLMYLVSTRKKCVA
jgi:hypothetical protein